MGIGNVWFFGDWQAAIAKAFVGAFVSGGICVVVDGMISSTGVIVRATRYELTYLEG